MRFSARLMSAVTPIVLAIPLFGFLVAIGTAGPPHQYQQPNPFRCDQVNAPPGTAESMVGDYSVLQSDSPVPVRVLAIGAIIPPTEGRFVAEGHRWFFVADYPEFAAVIMPKSLRRQERVNVFRAASTRRHVLDAADFDGTFSIVHGQTITSVTGSPQNPLRSDDLDDGFAFAEQSDENYDDSFPDRMAVADNLMLGRVAERIDHNQLNNGWTISGEVIQQRGRPCLFLHSADRSAPAFPEADTGS